MIPLIGYVASYDGDRECYEKPTDFIHSLGANIIFLSHTTQEKYIDYNVNLIDGLIIGGGIEDISPKLQNEETLSQVEKVDLVRDYFDIELIKKCSKKNIPILGICRGMQIINIAFGGSLYQDIKDQCKNNFIDHLGKSKNTDKYIENPNMHHITINKNTKLFNIIKKNTLKVNSYHHQAIRKLADEFIISSYSEDNIVESIENHNYCFLMGTQWHIELLEKDNSQILLMKEFLNHALLYKQKTK